MNTELIEREPVSTPDATPAGLIQYAMRAGNVDIEKLQQLFELQKAYEANEARKAYVAAMVEFKKNPPEIFKTAHVKFGTTEYMHATLGEVCSITAAALADHGISHRWDTEQGDQGRIKVTCILTHQLGHSERTELSSGADKSGGKNDIQAIASTVSYMQRYTLLAAAGLATKDMDDDSRSRGRAKESTITGKRRDELGEIAAQIREYADKADDWGAFSLYEPITDNDEKEYLWPLLPPDARSMLKRCGKQKREMEPKNGAAAQ
jgi:hypothetical protein